MALQLEPAPALAEQHRSGGRSRYEGAMVAGDVEVALEVLVDIHSKVSLLGADLARPLALLTSALILVRRFVEYKHSHIPPGVLIRYSIN